jgi:hypothetical protein
LNVLAKLADSSIGESLWVLLALPIQPQNFARDEGQSLRLRNFRALMPQSAIWIAASCWAWASCSVLRRANRYITVLRSCPNKRTGLESVPIDNWSVERAFYCAVQSCRNAVATSGLAIMPTYRATILDSLRRPLLRTTFDALSEPEAMERARHLAHGREVEIERLGHTVAHIPSETRE